MSAPEGPDLIAIAAQGKCEGGGRCTGAVRCGRHAGRWAKATMEKRGWVCINEYGTDAAEAVNHTFIKTLEAVQLAGVDLQRWLAGWDDKRGTPLFGVWAPKAVAAILGTIAGKASAVALSQAFKQAKVNPEFATAVDAAWRMGGPDAAIAIIAAELPHIAAELNATVTK